MERSRFTVWTDHAEGRLGCWGPAAIVPGPEICTFSYSVHNFLPAGTRCAFDVTIDYEVTGTIHFYENPPRAVATASPRAGQPATATH